jgi:hypothetical protein
METVAANFVFIIKLAIDPVEISGGGQSLMKGGIKNRNLGTVGKKALGFPDSREIGRVMKRRQLTVLLDRRKNLIIDYHRCRIIFSPMDNPVTHHPHIGQTGEYSPVFIKKSLADQIHGLVVTGNGLFYYQFTLGSFLGQHPFGFSNSFNQALAQTFPLGHQEDFVFQG